MPLTTLHSSPPPVPSRDTGAQAARACQFQGSGYERIGEGRDPRPSAPAELGGGPAQDLSRRSECQGASCEE
eukprot:6549443-Prymnesium_polylepis.1